MINISNITLRLGTQLLFDEASLLVTRGQKVALIGANGAGKSTLFGLILRRIHADGGEVSIPSNLLINHVAQELIDTDLPAVEFVRQGDHVLYALEQELLEAEKKHDHEKIAELHMQLANKEAYTSKSKAAKLLNGLGFSTGDEERPVNAFSGGWRIRLNLAQALMSDSDILLLDEPTNHLDIEAIVWLENYLKNYKGTLLLISHDRDFLDAIVDTVAHIDQKKIKRYTGNYTGFETLRAQQLALQQALYEKQQEKIAHMMDFVNRFRAKASKAKQAQSRLKAVSRIETVAAVQMASSFTFEFKQPKNVGDPIVYFESVSIGYETREILKNISLSIRKGNRIGLLGPNGAGKSTLIKCLAGELSPKKGQITMAQGCGIGYFAQHQLEQLFLDETPLQHMRRIDAKTSELELRKFLGSFNFSGPMALSPIQHFSGGEKARLSLAMLVWHSPNLLLLDEPTNHFDMDMREALTLALQTYEGAMVLVSHDRHMLRSTVDEFYLIADGKVSVFDGDVDDYYQWFLKYKAKENSIQTLKETSKEKNLYQFNKEQKKLAQQLKTLEGKISHLRNELKTIETQLADSSLYETTQQNKLNELLQKQEKTNQELEKLEEDWMNLSMKLES